MKFKHLERHILALLLVCAMLAALLTGCGTKPERDVLLFDTDVQSQDKCALTFFGFKADAINLTAIEDAMDGFMAEYSQASITYEGIKGTGYYDVLAQRCDTGNLDDVFMADHDRLVAYAQAGHLAELSDLPGLDGYTDAAREQFTDADGKVYFLPTCISTYNLYINYDLMAAHGQDIPSNWTEFAQVCDYFVSQGIVPIVGNNFASLSSLITARAFADIYRRPDAAAVITSFNTDTDALIAALKPGVEMAAEMIDRGWFNAREVLTTAQTSDDLDLFAGGDRPFMISGGWATVRLPSRGVTFAYGAHPYPVLEDGSILSMQIDTCIAVNADSENLELAKDFVAYLIRPDVMWNYCDSQASYTPLQEEKRIPSEETLVPSSSYLSSGPVVMRSDYRLTIPLNTALVDCANALLEGQSVTRALDAVVRALTA